MTLYGTAEGVATRRGLVASWGRWGWLALWCALWAGLNAAPVAVGAETLHTVRGWMPLLAGSLILAVGDPVRVLTLRDPLSLCTLYGMIGLGASLLCSPDPATACYWASAYLAVPMVLLWCRMQDDGARRLDTIVTVTWGLVAASGLILIGAAWMASGSVWLGDLYGITGRMPVFAGMPMARGTGIARYAGLIAVIALTRLLWSRSLRIRTVWIIVLVVCGVIMWRSLSAGANLAWLAAATGWFVLTVTRDRRERFAFGAVVAGFAALGALNIANPDALTARVNLARAAQGRELDYTLLARLSSDATPVIVRHIAVLRDDAECGTLAGLAAIARAEAAGDWRGFKLSRYLARRAVSQTLDERLDCSD